MVKSVKTCLKKSLGHSLLKLIELQTLLAEIQAVINDRPIIFVYDDDEGITYPLTPAELIHGRRITSYNDKTFEIFTTNEALTKRAKHHKNLLRGFINRWHIKYLQGIQEVSCNIRRKESKPDIEIGEVEVVKDSNIAK